VVSADTPASYQWSGASTAGVDWSDSANWTQQAGPTGPVSRAPVQDEAITSLNFQAQPGEAHNDLTGLTVNQLTDFQHRLTGNPITLGAGGLTISGATTIELPITLGAGQTWHGQDSTTEAGISAAVTGGLTGAGSPLTITAGLALGGDNEIGDVTASGNGADLVLRPGSKLNATDGHTVTAQQLAAYGASVGALNADYVQVGQPTADVSGSLAAPSATVDRSLSFALAPKSTGNTAGTDYGQLTATGAVNITGAGLKIDKTGTLDYDRYGNPKGSGPYCGLPAPIGTVYTLVSAPGGLTGKFNNVYGDGLFKDSCQGSPAPTQADSNDVNQPATYRIAYTANSVTATVISSKTDGPCGSVPCPAAPSPPATGPSTGPSAVQIAAAL
jgi:hypothetical protein